MWTWPAKRAFPTDPLSMDRACNDYALFAHWTDAFNDTSLVDWPRQG